MIAASSERPGHSTSGKPPPVPTLGITISAVLSECRGGVVVSILVTSGRWLQSDGSSSRDFLRKGLEHRFNSGFYVQVFPSWEKTKHKHKTAMCWPLPHSVPFSA